MTQRNILEGDTIHNLIYQIPTEFHLVQCRYLDDCVIYFEH